MWSSSLGFGLRELAFSEVSFLRVQRLHADSFSISTIERFISPRKWAGRNSQLVMFLSSALLAILTTHFNVDLRTTFTVPLSTNVGGIFCVFYGNETAPMVSNVTFAALLQRCTTRFWRKTGSPNGTGLPPFGRNEIRLVQDLNTLYIGPVEDEPFSRKRCTYE